MSYQSPDPHAANNPQGQNQVSPPQPNPGYGQQFGEYPPRPRSYQQPTPPYSGQTPFSNLPTQPLPNISPKQGKNRKQGARSGKSLASKKRQSAWKRVLSIAAVAVAALVTASFTNLGNTASGLIGNLFSSAGLPVQITLVHTGPAIGDSHVFANAFVPSGTELSQLSLSNPTPLDHEAWFTSKHGADADLTLSEFVVEGNRNHTVRITNIEPIVRCQPPLKGTLFYSPPAGDDQSTRLFFNLDTPGAAPSYMMNGNIGHGFFGTYTVSLQQGEQYTFKIVASTAKYFCAFTLVMTVLDGNKVITETITNNGQPFQVTATLGKNLKRGTFSAYQVLYVGGVMTYPSPNWVRENPNTYNPYA